MQPAPEAGWDRIETLRRDGEFVLSRGVGECGTGTVLMLAAAAERPSLHSIERLKHEYGLRELLDPAWAARPRALVGEHGRTLLLLDDPGAELLSRRLGRPMDTEAFLRVAIGIATALARMHGQGLIHKDVKPDHLLVDVASGAAWLTGFGIASRLARERQGPDLPEMIAGTLAYMAPEQTGRMNRSVDARSDLYALGVTLYQMLTGELPFTAADSMELVHCHIARSALPPSERVAGVPPAICAVVMKLLAKTPEERYQSAAGVAADLKRCLAIYQASGGVASFPLGAQDIPDVLRIPEKLYGREHEVGALLGAFERVVSSGLPELVLISGYSGIGKSSVVNEVHKVLVPPRGLFASGKFDQYKRDIPYSTLAQAFQNLTRRLLAMSDADLGPWREALREALGANGRLMTELVPELTLIIGEQPPVAELPAQDAQRRFQMVFRRFIGVFARQEHPLALFLDDLQWLDAATLDLLEDLLARPDLRHLLLIGAYRDNEVTAAHPLMRKLDAIRTAGGRLAQITLAPLAREHLGQLIADALRCEPERAAPLAQLVHEKTGGNPFFAIQFMSSLAEEGMLAFDHAAARWSWDLDDIHAKGYTDNVVDLVIAKLARVPGETQEALQLLACLGNSAEITTLSIVLQTSTEQGQGALWPAVRHELVERLAGTYRFLHDRIQEAAYSTIPEESRAPTHLRIGRLLASHTPPERRQEAIFEIVNQLNRGTGLVSSKDEREEVAELNLAAGLRAKAATANGSALSYLNAGAALLADDCWERRHQLAFSLEINRAECEFLTGALGEAEQRLAALFDRAADTVERASVACLRMDLYTTLNRSDRAVAVGLDYLRHLGMDWSPHPGEEEGQQEYARIWSRLGSRSIEELIELPLMRDPASLGTLDVLTKILPPALFTDANLFSLASCRAVNISLESGNCGGSCVAYVWLGMIAGPRFGNYKAGFEFGRLGYELVEKRGLTRFEARTCLWFAQFVVPWTKHVLACRDLMRRGFDAANRSGDLTIAGYACNNLVTNFLAAGDPLAETHREADRGFEFARQARFGFVMDIIAGQLGLIRTLRGLTPKFGSFDDGRFDEERFEAHLAAEPSLALPECWYWTRKLQARFFAGDHESAVEASLNAERLLWTTPSIFEKAECHFYGALARAASCDTASGDARLQHFEALAAHHKLLQVWAENCPENFENRVAVVGAEIARLEGRELDAERLYEQAIRSARANRFVHNEALAYELAGRFYAVRGLEHIGTLYLRKARYCYLRWGADGKVRQLDETYPGLREEERAPPPTSTIGTPVEHLDLATVVKLSQAVSGEIVLENLIDKLMSISLEHAGAQRGLLILPHGEEQRIEAQAVTGSDRVNVGIRDAAVTPRDLPESVLRYVLRTQDIVLLDDASMPNPYSADPYIAQNHSRSILCLPLLKQARLIGVLYLENGLASRVFTPARAALLKLLASQAAIALENARLYADLRRSEERYALAVDAAGDGHTDWIVATDEFYASPRALEMAGLRPDTKFSGRADFLARIPFHPEDRDRVLKTLDAHYAGDSTRLDLDTRLVRGGETRWLRLAVRCSRAPSGALLRASSAITDVTERQLATDALRESEARFRALTGLSSDWYWKQDENLRFTYVSEQVGDVIGHPAESSVGKARWELDNITPLSSSWSEHQAVLAARLPFRDFEYRRAAPDGSTRYISVSGAPLFEQGRFKGYQGVGREITDRKAAQEELLRLERRLRQAQRLEAMGTLAGGIAHDFNNILGSVLGFGERALGDAPHGGRLYRDLDAIMSAGERGRALVDRILAFSASSVGERVPVHVEAVVREALDLLAGKLPAGVRVEADLRAGRAATRGDPTQLHQVLMNLATNAVQAMPSGGTLRVALEAPRVGEARLATVGNLEAGDYIVLTVTDTGIGMAPEVLERIFDPFFTTKDTGGGTGLGLSLVHGIIGDMEGAIDVGSKRGEGSVFTVYLPRTGDVADSAEEHEPAVPRGAGQRVLVVDDEQPLVRLAIETLEDLGYRPMGFTSGAAALEAFRADPRRFDALITDERMPGLTGSALIREVRGIRDDLPTLLMSGFVGGGVMGRARDAGAGDVIKKPLSARELATSLARALHSP